MNRRYLIDRLNWLTLKALTGTITKEEDAEGTRLIGELFGIEPVQVQD